ncbi:hypothetical protein Trydic_g2996, partial [Trypoxylus dichotomus]
RSDPSDCTKFYRCANEIEYQFSCPKGTVWDSSINSCNYPWAVYGPCGTAAKPPKPAGIPEQAGLPGQPGQPSQEGNPVQPGGESQPGQSEQGGQPGLPGQGGQPGQPGQGGQPAQGGQPGLPGQAGQGGQPEQPGKPGQGGEPGQPGKPEQGGQPEQPGKPEQGGQPEQSGKPDQGEQSGQGGQPGQPGHPGQPGQGGHPGEENAPVTGGKCKHEEFRADPSDCTKFYRCANGVEYKFSCPKGTVWDPSINSCNYPWAVYGKCGTATEPPKPIEPSKPIEGGEPGDQGTQGQPGESEPEGKPGESDKPEESSKPVESVGQPGEIDVSGTSGTSDKPGGPILGGRCKGEEFKADPADCTKFYRCANGIEYQFSCANGTVWDSSINSCNYPWTVSGNCSLNTTNSQPSTEAEYSTTTTESSISSTSTQTSTQTPSETTTITEQPVPPGETGKNCTNGDLTPDKKDCSKFHRCANGIDYVFTCNQGTVWDPYSKTCNYPWAVYGKCGTATEPPTTQSPTQTSTEVIGQQCTKEGNFPDSDDCAKFYKCVLVNIDGNQEFAVYYYTCPEDTIFDVDLNKCTQRESGAPNRNCSSSNSTDSSTTEVTTTERLFPSTLQSTTDISATTEVLSSTSLDLVSTLSTTYSPELTTEPASSSVVTDFNTESTTDSFVDIIQTTSISTDIIVSTTTSATTTTPTCPIGQLEGDQIALVCPTGFKRHPKYCNLFYQCTTDPESFEVKILILSCPTGTLYDENKVQCLPPEETTPCDGELTQQTYYRKFDDRSLPPIEINKREALCPGEGYYDLEDSNSCNTLFLKCLKPDDNHSRMNAYVYQCPQGYAYWSISKRCEKKSRLLQCQDIDSYSRRWEIPVEKINVSYKRDISSS